MDSELFTVGGLSMPRDATLHSRDISKTATSEQVNYQKARTLQTYRYVGKVLYWAVIVLVINMIILTAPFAITLWNGSIKSSFTQKKEGLQYLGASTNIVRDDTGWPSQDSLAESSMMAQNSATNMLAAPAAAPKATFVVPRERMSAKNTLTPEEALLKRQQAAN